MHPLIARDTGTGWIGSPARGDDFTLSTATRRPRRSAQHRPGRRVPAARRTTPPAPRCGPAVLDAVLEAAPGMVVVDEAYAEFSAPAVRCCRRSPASRGWWSPARCRKAFAFAGARLGYLAAVPPSSMRSAGTAAVPPVCAHPGRRVGGAAARRRDAWHRSRCCADDRDAMVRSLAARGFDVVPTDANFVLFGGLADEQAVWQALLDRGVLIRDVGLAGWLRVSVGTGGRVRGVP